VTRSALPRIALLALIWGSAFLWIKLADRGFSAVEVTLARLALGAAVLFAIVLPGVIGRAVLATLLPARRLRFSARKVKCATSRYLNREDARPPRPAAITAIDIAISTPPVDLRPGRTHRERNTRPVPVQPALPLAGRGSPPSSPASPRASGAATSSPSCWVSSPGTCSLSSANGHGWGSSPAPASAPANSTRRQPRRR
jgi:hypothetical protein